jgi:predicted transcriptional regulator
MCRAEHNKTAPVEDINRGRGREYYLSLSKMREEIDISKARSEVTSVDTAAPTLSKAELHRRLSEQHKAQQSFKDTAQQLGLDKKLEINKKKRVAPSMDKILNISEGYKQLEASDREILKKLAQQGINPLSKKGIDAISDAILDRQSPRSEPKVTVTNSGSFLNRKITISTQYKPTQEPEIIDNPIVTTRRTFWDRLFKKNF